MESFEIKAPCADDETAIALVFEKKGDRWLHRIEWIDGGSRATILESIEGTDTDAWPPSPPLQEISRQEIGDQAVLLAVGMAGHGHWSASFSIDHGIQLDWACLDKKAGATADPAEPVFLGTSYRVSENTLVQLEKGQAVLTHQNVTIRMESSTGESAGDFCPCEGGFRFQPVNLSNSAQVATRWKHDIRCQRVGS